MRSGLLNYIRGYVKVDITGKLVETFINKATDSGFVIWELRRTGPDSISLVTDLDSFFKMKPLLRETRCKIRVGRRRGLPFLLRRAESRVFFTAGFVVFLLGIYLLSQVIWKVEVTGNEKIAYHDVIAAAQKLGIRPYQWKFKLGEPGQLAREMVRTLDGAAWVGVEVRGTRVLIQVVEQTKPDERKLMNPRHLVSKFDAVVTKIYASRGKPLVRVNRKVKQGDILISGLVGDESGTASVVAEGTVKGLVWHKYKIVSPLARQHKVYTGQTKTNRYMVIGNKALQLTGYGKPKFDIFESDMQRKTLSWRNWKLPIGWITEVQKEARVDTDQVSLEAARKIGLDNARADLWRKAGRDAAILAQNILHERVEGGKVYMEVLFEVEQDITKEVPIVQGDV